MEVEVFAFNSVRFNGGLVRFGFVTSASSCFIQNGIQFNLSLFLAPFTVWFKWICSTRLIHTHTHKYSNPRYWRGEGGLVKSHKIVIAIITIQYWIFHMPCIQPVPYWTLGLIAKLMWYTCTFFSNGVCMLNITRISVVSCSCIHSLRSLVLYHSHIFLQVTILYMHSFMLCPHFIRSTFDFICEAEMLLFTIHVFKITLDSQ